MRHRKHRSRVLREVGLEPADGFGVEVVCRLIKEENVRFLEEQPAEGHPPPLPSRKHADIRVPGRAPEGVHRLLQLAVQVPCVLMVDLLLEF